MSIRETEIDYLRRRLQESLAAAENATDSSVKHAYISFARQYESALWERQKSVVLDNRVIDAR